ncbi:MAG: hypothetical protein ACJAT7_000127 [Psychromonas sp.]|jgi:hypothetical protein|uniref:immunoglobulin-like domain-containing protein n=1 Tax=Psychromonas sp. TaxID=1884585 RepID=UPI0039E5F5BF
MKLQGKLLSLLVASALTGCGDSYGPLETPIAEPQPQPISLSGKVADGYLSGANICLDINVNKICDAGEPSATSSAGGAFNIENLTQSAIDSFPLLAEIIKGQTIDEDNPNVALTKSYTLSAPAGFTFVSPLTTMIQNEIEKGTEALQAAVIVQEQLGTTFDLNIDYIEAKHDDTSSDENQADFEKLHQVAQVAARVIADNREKFADNIANEDISIKELNTLIMDGVFAALDEISVQVEMINADIGSFDPDAIATDINERFIIGPLPDTQAPVISLVGPTTINLTVGDAYREQGANVTDNLDTELVAAVSGTINTDIVGTYTLTYKTQDAAGNSATATRTIKVVAVEPAVEVFYLFHSQHDDSAYVQYWGDVWTSGTVYSEYTEDSIYPKALEIPSGSNWGNVGAIAWGNEEVNAIDISAYTHVKFKVKTDTFTTVSVVVISPNAPDYEVGYIINDGLILEDGWVEIEASLPDFSDMTWFGLKFDGQSSGTTLLADVHFVTQEILITGPTEAAPFPPQLSDQEALVLYSDSLKQDKYISVWNSNWWNAPIYSEGDVDGDHYAKYEITALGIEGGAVGLEFGIENGVVDASEKTTMNFDMYVETGITQIQLKLVSENGDSLYKTLNPPTGEWISHEAVFAELEVLSGTLDPSTLKLAGFIAFGEAGSSFYVDNIYFSGESIFSDLVVTVKDNNDNPITGAIVTVGGASVTTDANGLATLNLQEGEHAVKVSVDGMALTQQMQSNIGGDTSLTVVMEELYPAPLVAAPLPEIANANAFVLYSDALAVDKNISYWEDNWWNAPLFSAVQIAGNNTAKFQITPGGVAGGVTGIQYGIQGGSLDLSDKTGMRFNMYATNGVSQAVFQVVSASGPGVSTMLPVTTGQWISVDLVFDDLVGNTFDPANLSQLGLQLWGTTRDSVYLDNIYFY